MTNWTRVIVAALLCGISGCSGGDATSPYTIECTSGSNRVYAQVNEPDRTIFIYSPLDGCNSTNNDEKPIKISKGHRQGYWVANYGLSNVELNCRLEWNSNSGTLASYAWETRSSTLVGSFVGSCRETELDVKDLP